MSHILMIIKHVWLIAKKREMNLTVVLQKPQQRIKILATYNNRGRHTRIWILEAPDYHAVDKALETILKFENYDIMPVSAM